MVDFKKQIFILTLVCPNGEAKIINPRAQGKMMDWLRNVIAGLLILLLSAVGTALWNFPGWRSATDLRIQSLEKQLSQIQASISQLEKEIVWRKRGTIPPNRR